MHESSVISTETLVSLSRLRAQAEFAEADAMLRFHQARWSETQAIESRMRRVTEQVFLATEIGCELHLSEGQVQNRLHLLAQVRETTPSVWSAWEEGRVDLARVRTIGDTISVLERPESHALLDERVVGYAESHTVVELRAWLRRFVLRIEADLAIERAEQRRAERRVDVNHAEDGMGYLDAYLTSHQLAAIDKRLTKEAKALGADDPRTLQQRRADLLASWLTTNEAGEPALNADIAVTIAADVLAGAVDGFALAADGSWGVPAGWIAELALTGNPFWHRIVFDPVDGDVLSHEYLGRFAPELLAKAINFRDGVCQAPGCCKPADRCELDHRTPWPEGPTSGANMWALCRRHHNAKGHRVLSWMMPSGRIMPAERADFAA